MNLEFFLEDVFNVSMPSSKSARSKSSASARLPLTITLTAKNFEFIESCVDLKEFRSIDELFDAALAFYRRHVHALNAYADEQVHKGYTRRESLESVQCETLVTRTR
jgi:hypothetical protein